MSAIRRWELQGAAHGDTPLISGPELLEDQCVAVLEATGVLDLLEELVPDLWSHSGPLESEERVKEILRRNGRLGDS